MKNIIFQCPHFGKCAGCIENPSFDAPPTWNDVLSSYTLENPPFLHQGNPYHWRHRAKMAVRGTPENPSIGLFKKNSHEVLPIPSCLVHHSQLNPAFEAIRKWMIQNSIAPYQEETGLGDLRYLQGVVHRETQKVQLTFVLNFSNQNQEKTSLWMSLLSQFASENDLCHSIWINFNRHQTNTIFGPHWLHVCGEKDLWEKFGTTQICYGPASFGQANLPLFEKMLFKIVDLLPENSSVAEFYAGVGAIGLFITSHCQSVRCSEINPFAETYFNLSRSRMAPQDASKITFTTAPTHKSKAILEGATTAIVDPPRKGLDPTLFPSIKNSSLNQLLYISCGWDSFKKDCQQLLSEGWNLKSLDGYHFFPGSNHLELLANFVR